MADGDPATIGPLLQRGTLSSPSTAIWRLFRRRIFGDSSSRVLREAAIFHLDERHSDWGYSRPVVILDLIWNLAFIVVSSVVLMTTAKERPSTPLRAWIVGYAMQCLMHVSFVLLEYRRRALLGSGLDDGSPEDRSSFAKNLESGNTMISFIWWLVGFYWIVIGGQALLQDAPHLYWLTVVFLAFDVFFAIFCILLACVVGMALCCCLPCILAFLYAVAGQEAASEADISVLPRFRYHGAESFDSTLPQTVGLPSRESRFGVAADAVALSPDDSECCICLSRYEEGVEIQSLPCNHYFHSGCIVKWLHINTTCPLCKYNILRGDEQV